MEQEQGRRESTTSDLAPAGCPRVLAGSRSPRRGLPGLQLAP